MLKRTVFIVTIITISTLLSGWGDVGHSVISMKAELFFNHDMDIFKEWLPYLAAHSSDADLRKKDDPEEGPRHYIDIDNYESFVTNGRIPSTLDSVITMYGEKFVDDNGYLPWATIAAYDSVVACLVRNDMVNGKKHAADLGHYVADGHMPMHLTRNYDGQFTGNKGIHFRYEIKMIGLYEEQINYQGTPTKATDNVEEYIFRYIYQNYPYMDSILIADNAGKEIDPEANSDQYYAVLWEQTQNMTNTLFERASCAFAELLYTALLEARLIVSDSNSAVTFTNPIALSVSPNPVRGIATINCSMSGNSGVAAIYDANGRLISNIFIPDQHSEFHSVCHDFNSYETGIYYCIMKTEDNIGTETILVSR